MYNHSVLEPTRIIYPVVRGQHSIILDVLRCANGFLRDKNPQTDAFLVCVNNLFGDYNNKVAQVMTDTKFNGFVWKIIFDPKTGKSICAITPPKNSDWILANYISANIQRDDGCDYRHYPETGLTEFYLSFEELAFADMWLLLYKITTGTIDMGTLCASIQAKKVISFSEMSQKTCKFITDVLLPAYKAGQGEQPLNQKIA